MPPPEAFAWTQRKHGDIVITHHGKEAAVLRRSAAVRFLIEVERCDVQHVMARKTGNYRRGNERRARS